MTQSVETTGAIRGVLRVVFVWGDSMGQVGGADFRVEVQPQLRGSSGGGRHGQRQRSIADVRRRDDSRR